MQTFSSHSLLNYEQNFPVIASESEEEFDFSPFNVATRVHISNNLDILEIISDFRSDPFTLIDLDIPANSYRIACTNTQSFEEGENCASTIFVGHAFGYDMNLFGYDMILFGSDIILFGSSFNFREPLVILVAILINFSVKNQVPKVSFKIVDSDLMSVFSHEFVDIIFCEYLDILE